MKRALFILIIATLHAVPVLAQSNLAPDSLSLMEMGKITFLTGTWSGTGWIQLGNARHSFTQHENVTLKVNGTVMEIDGLGTDPGTGKTIHQAFAIISYDLPNKRFLMRAFRADGNYIDADASVENGKFIWGFTHPQAGQMRYTSQLKEDKWVEIGEMSRDGKNWFQFFEMKLTKQ